MGQNCFNKDQLPIKNINLQVVTSPCTQSGSPMLAIISRTGITFSKLRTPDAEFVVAPAGYNLTA